MFDNVKKETGAPTAVPPNGDDALFEALGTNKKSLRQRKPVMVNWMGCLNESMRITFPGSCPTNALPKCPSVTGRNRQRYPKNQGTPQGAGQAQR